MDEFRILLTSGGVDGKLVFLAGILNLFFFLRNFMHDKLCQIKLILQVLYIMCVKYNKYKQYAYIIELYRLICNYIEDRLYHTFHPSGELGEYIPTLQPMYEKPLIYVVNMHIHVKSSKLEPSIQYPCSYDSFETCLQTKRKELNTSCQVPFETDVNDNTICKTDEEGYKVMKELSKLTSKCKPSCQVVDIRIEEIPQNYGVLSRNENFKVGLLQVSKMTPGYYINIPSTASLTSISYDYGFISYVAEFAGWSGIFVGASVLWIVGIITSLFSWVSSIKIEQKSLTNVVKILSLFYLLYLVYTCTVKFVNKPQGVMVDFKNTKIEFDMTICSSKFLVGFLRGGSLGDLKGIFLSSLRYKPNDVIKNSTFFRIQYGQSFEYIKILE